jgi:hypothetical protein
VAHEGNPDFRSEIERIEPSVDGVAVEVLNYDDSLRLTNKSGETVVVLGYDGEPYVRILGDGTVEVNTASPAYYLNRDRFADVDVPDDLDERTPPSWVVIDKTSQYSWHDHRAHYMATGTPPQVKDEGQRTKVFDYEIPIRVADDPGAIRGTLFWVGHDDGFPIAPFLALAAALAVLIGVALLRRRRRGTDETDGEAAW